MIKYVFPDCRLIQNVVLCFKYLVYGFCNRERLYIKKGVSMKVVFTTLGHDLEAQLDPRFGRAKGFILYDLEADSFEYVDNNQNLNATQGAGIQAAESVARLGAKALVTGHCGPKAFQVLQMADVHIFHTDAKTVKEALEHYKAGHLTEAGSSDVDGHWV